VALANAKGLDVVLATDPDCDRMGCAVRNRAGKMELLTGNQTGALLRTTGSPSTRSSAGSGGGHARTPPSSRPSSPRRCRTPSGAARREGHQHAHRLQVDRRQDARLRGAAESGAPGPGFDYDATPFRRRAAKLLQQHSTFYVFGTEESYGYLPNDFVRDKDGNAACLMFAELCAWVKSRGLTVPEYLDEIYLKYGFFLEGVINIYYEGASGAAKIKRILDTYRAPAAGVWRREGDASSRISAARKSTMPTARRSRNRTSISSRWPTATRSPRAAAARSRR
jgi:phosphoglucomutase